MLPDGTGYLVNDDLSRSTPTRRISCGRSSANATRPTSHLGRCARTRSRRGASFKVDGPVAGFALTVESAGGVPVTANDPIAVGNVSRDGAQLRTLTA